MDDFVVDSAAASLLGLRLTFYHLDARLDFSHTRGCQVISSRYVSPRYTLLFR